MLINLFSLYSIFTFIFRFKSKTFVSLYLQNDLYFSSVLGNINSDKKTGREFLCHTEHILNTNSSHKAIPYPNFCRGCNKTYHAGTVLYIVHGADSGPLFGAINI